MSPELTPAGADTPSDVLAGEEHESAAAMLPDVNTPGPWAMQLAVRYDKQALPCQVAVCEAAAQAVVTLLADARSRQDGAWAPAVRRWRDGRIRKLVRRARGQRWDRVQEVPGVTVEHRGASVRACVPMPARPLPPLLDALQVSGTSFPATTDTDSIAHRDHSPAVVVIALTPLAELTTGKAAAQCGHAAQLVWEHLVRAGASATLRAWHDDQWRVEVRDDLTATQWRDLATAPIQVVDAGYTEVDGPTETTRAWWTPAVTD
ncbi:hypothetical protein KEM60_01591 [Austwickia sp. TVS 96-490-7B]|uniref:peptidyl-tRNA hydrolase n=1 Tax=Austwickia sp. TVS 96-490-7B TaxID=2830843 RepID=UPI001D64BEEB|nr:peptidyl-tRNA hydrolase [Austwickia sp. TVS 96-490-7B]MBW3085391.1 hypothetical protein [Austwickia sp. TVS 96-490-7B]